MLSVLRRVRIVTVRVTVANLTIRPMNHDIDSIASSGGNRRILRVRLSRMDRGCAVVSLAENAPAAISRNDVNVLTHDYFLQIMTKSCGTGKAGKRHGSSVSLYFFFTGELDDFFTSSMAAR